MRWFQAGIGFKLNLQLVVDELPAQADNGEIQWSMRDQAGNVVGAPQRTGSATGTTGVLELTDSDMTLTAGNETEARYASVRFQVEGVQQEQRLTFGVAPFLPIEADARLVRTILGLSGEELASDEVDVVTAFYTLKETYGNNLLAALSSGKVKLRNSVNRAVALKAAIQLIPSLQLRTYQTTQNENSMFTRFRAIDWDRLLADLEAQLAESLADAGLTGDVTESYPVIFLVSQPQDPVTGQ
ncbi:hypothetical protein PJWF_00013 [Achromobacter phage JWF]|uniref:hypothetical protein n=1 Tax=Achromobacter phage JWF TaxID=1589748 RepID=UPI000588E064|nr:hypothetical protein AXJ13_gp013 [Achromobacter phage JWF]AJD82907.1 hypothetical protein PJWF_00013 [Achromobacter phage JWF]